MEKILWLFLLHCVDLNLAQYKIINDEKQDGLSRTTPISQLADKMTSFDSVFEKDVMAEMKYINMVITRLEHERSQLITFLNDNKQNDTNSSGLQNYLFEMTEKVLHRTNEQIEEMKKQKAKLSASISPPVQNLAIQNLPENSLSKKQMSAKMDGLSTTEKPSDKSTFSSNLLCQFFIFGTLFGVVCSISTCTCFFHPRNSTNSSQSNLRRRRRIRAVADLNPSRIPQPFDCTKPCKISFDERGFCYASPLNDEEIPPLPTYEAALTLPTSPLPKNLETNQNSRQSSTPSHYTTSSNSSIFTTRVDVEISPRTNTEIARF